MYRLTIIILLIGCSFIVKAQRKVHEVGLFGGVSYYMGDVNPSKLFYSVEPTFSFIYKYNINSRYGIRFNGTLSSLSGNDADSENGYQQQRNHSFDIALYEFSVLCEFNFLPFKPESQYEFFSPYLVAGLGAMLYPAQSGSAPVQPVLPFGVGFKYAINTRLCVAAEWTYRKTFTDYLDQLPSDNYTQTPVPDNKQYSYSSSKDWYSFAGISFTYKFALGSLSCPAYLK
ncbi:MAG: DUF6089 family protein [Bacteroidales bacterium]